MDWFSRSALTRRPSVLVPTSSDSMEEDDGVVKIGQQEIYLDITFGTDDRTDPLAAVMKGQAEIVLQIHPNRSSSSERVKASDTSGNTALHYAAALCGKNNEGVNTRSKTPAEDIVSQLLKHGADVDAQNREFYTPLHVLTSGSFGKETLAVAKRLLKAGAELNTRNDYGDSPLHNACREGDRELIQLLIDNGADLDCRNLDWMTPQDVFLRQPEESMGEADRSSVKESFTKLKTMAAAQERTGRLPQESPECLDETRRICDEFPVYFRYQWPGLNPEPDGNTSVSWIRSDMKVSHVLYPRESDARETLEPVNGGKDFLENCERDFKRKALDFTMDKTTDKHGDEEKIQDDVGKKAWRWINFPSNNMTWIKDFIINNARYRGKRVDRYTWRFFEENIRVHETSNPSLRIRMPHAHASEKLKEKGSPIGNPERGLMSKNTTEAPTGLPSSPNAPRAGPTEKGHAEDEDQIAAAQDWSNTDAFSGSGKMFSLVVPFLDIETVDSYKSGPEGLKTQYERIKGLNEAYFPFKGMNGVQLPQTLDQSYYDTKNDVTELRTVEDQVIYRWSERKSKELKLFQEKQEQRHQQHQRQQGQPAGGQAPLDVDKIREERPAGREATNANAKRIRKDHSPKWLMIRQLWLWKLDNNTIVTAIPSRKNGMTADTLLETIRQGNMDVLGTPDDLIKRILYETVTFLEEFKWAGLGEHVLDIFEGEIAAEMDKEARFFKDFSEGNWSPRHVNESIQEAASCTYRIKDIRDELRLIRQVLETQSKVVMDFAAIFWPSSTLEGQEQLGVAPEDDLRARFVGDCNLGSRIQRVTQMEGDASTTLEGLSTIIQAMQAQASLKEAEEARFMNLMILPFTIVTVIFTPLSFLTSLFAVNTTSLPHNEDGEARLSASWFSEKMIIGEFASLLPLALLVIIIYLWQGTGHDSSSRRKRVWRLKRRKVMDQEKQQ